MSTCAAQRIKALRVQGSRSRNGCQACKLKHVKCDEAVPICGRCARNKRTCYYEDANNAPCTAGSKFVVYTIPQTPSPALELPSHDSRALWHFQYRTLQQIEGPFKTELWSCIIPQMIQTDPIVRQAVMALSSLHESYLDSQPTDPGPPDRALVYYQKARQKIISLESPDHFFDSILCASIIFSACEGLRGNFDTSTQHALAGLRMIIGRNTSAPRTASIFNANERTMFDVFLDLQSQVMEANENGFDMAYPDLAEEMLDLPDSFKSTEEAVIHIQILTNQIFDLYANAEEHHQTYPWSPSQVSPVLQPVYAAICSKFHNWEVAVSQLEFAAQQTNDRQRAAFTILKVFAFSFKIYLYVFVHGENKYDDLIQTNHHILNLIETYLSFHPDTASIRSSTSSQASASQELTRYRPLSFTSYAGVIPVLFEIASRTNDEALSQKAIDLLRTSNRREGVWDGQQAASLAVKLNQIRDDGELAAATNPGYKFLITDVQLLSDRKYLIKSGFKRIEPGSFDSWWLETIPPEKGMTQSQIVTI